MIREATSKDLQPILQLMKLNPEAYSKYDLVDAEEDITEILKEKEHNLFVKIVENKIVGCIRYSKEKDTEGAYCLSWLAVHPDFKRKGIATELYKYIEGKLISLKARIIFLNAGSKEINNFFYTKMGFKLCGSIPNYFEGKDLVWYYKSLSNDQ